jgi:hypothetical protein
LDDCAAYNAGYIYDSQNSMHDSRLENRPNETVADQNVPIVLIKHQLKECADKRNS